MIILGIISIVCYLIFFRNVKGEISFKTAVSSGLLGTILWIFVRIMMIILIIKFIISMFINPNH